jgi:urease accessory protein
VLQSAARAVVDAARLARHTPLHQLSLRVDANQVRLIRQDPPWKVVRGFPQSNGGVLVHLHNVSGGVLAGDRLALDVEVAPDARAQITTTGATRLYRHRTGADDSEQLTRISIGERGLLEYLPDPIIPYAGARHRQRTEIRLACGAALFWWEVIAPGRQAMGERFAFDRLQLESQVFNGPRLVLRENFLLEPFVRPIAVTARMQAFSWTASLCICQEGRPAAFWRSLEDRLNASAQERTRKDEAIWGASTLAGDGVIVRGLSVSSRFLHGSLIEFWRIARQAVTGEAPILPRKVC